MCGFLGQFNIKTDRLPFDDLGELLRLSQNRGPDDSRFFTNNKNLWLGFNRLAILDLSDAGRQPMNSHSGRFTMVFNGEIYNHLELRERLEFQNWRSHSDTETILECIEQWGFEKTIRSLDGMFGLAVYDKTENALYSARDFAGIKPFFFGWNGNCFVFASQYDQIRWHPQYRDNKIDLQVLRLYLEQHFMPAPFGLLKQTGQLEPGQWVKVSSAGLEKHYYWQFPEFVEPEVFDEKKAHELIMSALSESVVAEMLADVPLGAFLSGGIDSPLICHYASENNACPLKTFTIGSDSKIHNESEIAAHYAALIGTEHHCEIMSAGGALEMFDEVMNCVREPMADFSIIPTYLVSRLTRKDVTVALSGDGGDELFFGYERFWSVAKNIHYQRLPWIIKAVLYKGDQYLTGNQTLNSVVLSKKQSMAHRGLHSRFPEELVDRVFPDLAKISTPPEYGTYNYANTGNTNRLIQSMRKAEFYGMMQKTLRKVDLASMGVSLEVRVPFLKKSFIETALKIDPMLSFGPGKKKQVLKTHLAGIHPKAPIDNIKRGFTVPLGTWLSNPDFQQKVVEKLLSKEFIEEFGIQAEAVKNLISDHNGAINDLKWTIFTLMALKN
jgi:asparagine synthase (glutamine-hydrolysing)